MRRIGRPSAMSITSTLHSYKDLLRYVASLLTCMFFIRQTCLLQRIFSACAIHSGTSAAALLYKVHKGVPSLGYQLDDVEGAAIQIHLLEAEAH